MTPKPSASSPALAPCPTRARAFLRRAPLHLALASLVAASTPAAASDPLRATRTTAPAKTVVVEAPADPGAGDLTGADYGDPGPFVGPLDPADDFETETDPLDPADDFKTDVDPIVPAGDDLVTDLTATELWLTAANAWHPMASIIGHRVFEWRAEPTSPGIDYRVYIEDPLDFNASLEVRLHVLPGYRYHVFPYLSGENLDEVGANFRFSHGDVIQQFTPTAMPGAPDSLMTFEGEDEPRWEYLTLELGSRDPTAMVKWTVDAVLVVAEPMP